MSDLNSRAFVARAARLAGVGFGAGMLVSWASLPIAYYASGRHPRLFNGVAAVSAVSILSATFFLTGAFGVKVLDGFKFPASQRVLGRNDPERQAARALLAADEFFRRSIHEQYTIATENPGTRRYLIDLARWMNEGVLNAPAPNRVDLP